MLTIFLLKTNKALDFFILNAEHIFTFQWRQQVYMKLSGFTIRSLLYSACQNSDRKAWARQSWHKSLVPALGRQKQVDLWVQGQPGLQSGFQDSQGYTEKLLPWKTKQKEENIITSVINSNWHENGCNGTSPSPSISLNLVLLVLPGLRWNDPHLKGATTKVRAATPHILLSLLNSEFISFIAIFVASKYWLIN